MTGLCAGGCGKKHMLGLAWTCNLCRAEAEVARLKAKVAAADALAAIIKRERYHNGSLALAVALKAYEERR